MDSIRFFTQLDIAWMGFIFPDPTHEDIFLNEINQEYIRRINKVIAKKLTSRETSYLSKLSRPEINEYIKYHYPDCISSIQTIKKRLEDELRQSRKEILSCNGPAFIIQNFNPSEIE